MFYAGKITQIPKEVANLLNHFKTTSRLSGIKPSGNRRLFTLAKGKPNAIGLGLGEPDFVPPPHVLEAAKKAKREYGFTYNPRDRNFSNCWGRHKPFFSPQWH